MRFFKKSIKGAEGVVQTAPKPFRQGHPFSAIDHYSPLTNAELRLYASLREAVPVIDAAIGKTVRLIGEFYVECEDRQVELALNQFLHEVQVNASNVGMDSFISAYLDQAITFGTAVGEIVLNPQETAVCGLYNAPLEDVELKTEASPLNLCICRRDISGKSIPVERPDLIVVSALNPSPGAVYGNSLLKGLPFVSRILLQIYQSIGLNWERVGNVRFAVTYRPGSDSTDRAFAKDRAMQIAQEWGKAMQSGGGVNDFIAVGDVDIKVIGADNQILDSQIPVRQMLEQIIAKLSIPPFLLGLSWSTSERMSTQQADILTSELEAYRRLLNPVISKVCSVFMRTFGAYSKFHVIWNHINLQDELQMANARLMAARAAEIEKRIF